MDQALLSTLQNMSYSELLDYLSARTSWTKTRAANSNLSGEAIIAALIEIASRYVTKRPGNSIDREHAELFLSHIYLHGWHGGGNAIVQLSHAIYEAARGEMSRNIAALRYGFLEVPEKAFLLFQSEGVFGAEPSADSFQSAM